MKKFLLVTLLGLTFASQSFAGTVTTEVIVNFAAGSSDISEKMAELIDQKILTLNPTKIEIIGHANEKGNSKQNWELSQERADTVKEYLVVHGMNQNIIQSTLGAGQSEPICQEKTKKCGDKNRRVELKIESIK